MEYVLSFLELHGKSLDPHPLLPESGSYLAGQSRAFGNPKLKLFHLRHDFNYTPERRQLDKSVRFLDHCKRGRANCNPHRFQPSMAMLRTTRALSIRFVLRSLTFFRTGARGISSDTRDRRRKGLRIASSAPPALSLSKVQNSMNSLPCQSTPRTNTGMARESRTQRRRSSAGCLAVVGHCPRRIRDHIRTEDGPPGRDHRRHHAGAQVRCRPCTLDALLYPPDLGRPGSLRRLNTCSSSCSKPRRSGPIFNPVRVLGEQGNH
jgi:hypothetical protein